jgi:hypothetical protein
MSISAATLHAAKRRMELNRAMGMTVSFVECCGPDPNFGSVLLRADRFEALCYCRAGQTAAECQSSGLLLRILMMAIRFTMSLQNPPGAANCVKEWISIREFSSRHADNCFVVASDSTPSTSPFAHAVAPEFDSAS